MHMLSESTAEFLGTDVVAPRYVTRPQIKGWRPVATRLAGCDGDLERHIESRGETCGSDGDAIRGLRYAVPASVLLWVMLLAFFQLFG